MNDAQSTIVGLKDQVCPGGGWTGMPSELEGRATVADCLAYSVCGCIYGDAVKHIERLGRLIQWCRPRLSKDVYQSALDAALNDPNPPEPDFTPIVQSSVQQTKGGPEK